MEGVDDAASRRPDRRHDNKKFEPVASTDPRAFLTELFNTAVAAGHPYQVLADHLPEDRSGRAIVIGAGKAPPEPWPKWWRSTGGARSRGLVVAPYRYGAQCSRIEVVEASHPVPDDAGERVARRVLELISGLNESDRVIFLLSGGGSALLSLPAEGIGLADKQAVNKASAQVRRRHRRDELRAQAPLGDQGRSPGQGLLAGQRLYLRDFRRSRRRGHGDRLRPQRRRPDHLRRCPGDPRRYAIDVPQNVLDWLADPRSETVKPDDPCLARSHFQLIATPQNALDAAAVKCRAAGFSTLILGDLEGEAREVAKVHAGIARQIRKHGQRWRRPA
ncbi:DUF4147 domain-containing protein [Pseudomonas aeruginosa]